MRGKCGEDVPAAFTERGAPAPANRERRKTIRAKLAQLADNPETQSANVKKLQGVDGYRLRVGDDRVIFAYVGDTVFVTKIAPRGSAY